MTPEAKRLEDAKARLLDASQRYTDALDTCDGAKSDYWKRELLVAAMDYAETVHFVEWLRHQTAKERKERLS